jgi:hypothetical protein
MREALHAFMRMACTSYERKWKEPDDGIVLRCLNAIGPTDMADVNRYLRHLFQNQQSPRHPNGPKGYAFFEAVFKNEFGKKPTS